MSRLHYDMQGERVPTGPNIVTRRSREAFMDGLMPSWITTTEGATTHLALGATPSPAGEGWLSNRGLVSVATSGITNARATLAGPLLDWQSFTAMIFTLRSLRFSAEDSTVQVEMGMKSDDGNYGMELRQTGAASTATMRTINAGTTTDTVIPLVFKNTGLQTISIAIMPRTNEWAVLREDQIGHYGVAPGWNWAAAGASRLLRPRISIQALTAVVRAINLGDFALTLDCY